jgi:hypothetical protein
MAKTKTLKTMFYSDTRGEGQVFWDEKEVIVYNSRTDAEYRNEYMNILFSHFGINIKYVEKKKWPVFVTRYVNEFEHDL